MSFLDPIESNVNFFFPKVRFLCIMINSKWSNMTSLVMKYYFSLNLKMSGRDLFSITFIFK